MQQVHRGAVNLQTTIQVARFSELCLMVSLKIIWMMHKQSKVEHFQFWILNSIDFRLNDISKEIRQLRDRLKGD
jgi:hypothetical protein